MNSEGVGTADEMYAITVMNDHTTAVKRAALAILLLLFWLHRKEGLPFFLLLFLLYKKKYDKKIYKINIVFYKKIMYNI